MQKLKKWVLLAEDDADLVDLYESLSVMHFGEEIKIVEAEDGPLGIMNIYGLMQY